MVGGEGWAGAALKRAVDLAKNNRARLTVIDVIEELPRDMITSMILADIQMLAVSERLKDLEHLIAPLLNKGAGVSPTVLV